MKLTFNEIIAKFEELNVMPSHLYNNESANDVQYDMMVSLGEPEIVKRVDGSDGESIIRVYHFKAHDVYIKISGVYNSWDSHVWNNEFTQTFPRRIIYTEYESKSERGDKIDEY